MTTNTTQAEPPIDNLTAACIRRLMQGDTREEVAEVFVELGMEREKAQRFVTHTAHSIRKFTLEEMKAMEKAANAEDGKGTMTWGAGCVLIGLAITFGTYEAAKGGGVYLVTGGLIVGGAIMFLRGLTQMVKST